jgi:hypothetical protein
MSHGEELRHRELSRRKALWELASISPGDPKALDILDVLDDIEQRDRHDTSMQAMALSVEQLRDSIPTEPHTIGCRIVREECIPQPWRERFLCASVGSTRVPEGPYAHDWDRFLDEWQDEMRLLATQRAAREKHDGAGAGH